MGWTFGYRCERCRLFQRVSTGAYRFYDVPRQGEEVGPFDRVSCHDAVGWCNRCRRLRPEENFPHLARPRGMRETAGTVRPPDLGPPFPQGDGEGEDGWRMRLLKSLDERIRWRAMRT